MNLGELDWQFAFSLVAAAGVLVAAIYHIMNLRYNMRARAMEICRLHMSDVLTEQNLQKFSEVMSLEWKDYKDFMNKYRPYGSDRKIYSKWTSILLMMETTGLLIKNKFVKAETIYDLACYGIILTWKKFKDMIQKYREDPTWEAKKALETLSSSHGRCRRSRQETKARFKDSTELTFI